MKWTKLPGLILNRKGTKRERNERVIFMVENEPFGSLTFLRNDNTPTVKEKVKEKRGVFETSISLSDRFSLLSQPAQV
jgi:hypothetical protein